MFRVSYFFGKYDAVRSKDFSSYASAQYYFLKRLHEGAKRLRLTVLENEALDDVSNPSEGEDK